MADSFTNNPAIGFSIGTSGNFDKRKFALARFLYNFCKRRNGVYLSRDQQGIICFYNSDTKVNRWNELFEEMQLVFSAIGLARLYRTWLRSHLIRKKQAAHKPFIHCWYIGISKEHRGNRTAFELKQLLFEEAKKTGRPILAETMIPQNKRVYERMGFQEYDRVEVRGTATFLLRYDG
ncbi:MAG: GNAT family N-acetyltransferase [Flavobacteriales bacterium]